MAHALTGRVALVTGAAEGIGAGIAKAMSAADAGIFVTDPAAGGIRPTKDVNAIVDVTSYAQYTALSDRLRNLGLVEDNSEGAPLCRWRQGNVIVDVMPTDASVLGFSNRWYPMAIDTAQHLDIAGHRVRIVTPALFIATKLEAFHGRGGNAILPAIASSAD